MEKKRLKKRESGYPVLELVLAGSGIGSQNSETGPISTATRTKILGPDSTATETDSTRFDRKLGPAHP